MRIQWHYRAISVRQTMLAYNRRMGPRDRLRFFLLFIQTCRTFLVKSFHFCNKAIDLLEESEISPMHEFLSCIIGLYHDRV